jgi:hypothetical protein
LSGRNGQTYQLWLEVRAGYPPPDDPIARLNLATIENVCQQVERQERQAQGVGALLALLGRK